MTLVINFHLHYALTKKVLITVSTIRNDINKVRLYVLKQKHAKDYNCKKFY